MEGELSVLLVDDGELGDAREVIAGLDVRLDEVRGEPTASHLEPPYDLIVSNVRQAQPLARMLAETTGEAVKAPWIAIHPQDFLPIRDRLRRAGVDYLVVDGVDVEVLRLLFLHALYGGPERRGQARLPVGADVVYEVRHNEGEARLIDLTPDGCRVIGAAPVGAGMQIKLCFPSGLSAGPVVTVQGRIVRVERTPGGEPSAAIRFVDLDARARAAVRSILEGQALGTRVTPLGVTPVVAGSPPPPRTAVSPQPEPEPPADQITLEDLAAALEAADADDAGGEPTLEPIAPVPPDALRSASSRPRLQLTSRRPAPKRAAPAPDEARTRAAGVPAAQHPAPDEARTRAAGVPVAEHPPEPTPDDELVLDQVDRRAHGRARYERSVTAQHGGQTLVLVGRDLSTQGMRVARAPGMQVGMELRVTIYGGPRQRPVVVPAEVTSDDGEQGFLLRFLPLKRPELERIEKMVAEAPGVQAVGGASGLRPVYLSESQTARGSIFADGASDSDPDPS